jgi:hypothetical protein
MSQHHAMQKNELETKQQLLLQQQKKHQCYQQQQKSYVSALVGNVDGWHDFLFSYIHILQFNRCYSSNHHQHLAKFK